MRERLAEGLTVEELCRAVDNKIREWNHAPARGEKDMRPYLRPETLFGPKCENYANERIPPAASPLLTEEDDIEDWINALYRD